MFDIFVYLFESYIHANACPESKLLTRKLLAAGFEDEEISEALEWLSGLRRITESSHHSMAPSASAVRIYSGPEQARISVECRGFIAFLENAGILDAPAREVIVERAMALGDLTLTLGRLKVIVLMVLWQREQPVDGLIIDELLADGDDGVSAAWH